MSEQVNYLILAVFNGQEAAQSALSQIPKRDRRIVSAVIMEKDERDQVQFRDVGLTPKKGALGGVVLGGLVGVLTGGAGLALAAAGGAIGRHSAKSRQSEFVAPDQLKQVAGSLGPDSSAIIAVSKRHLRQETADMLTALGAKIFETTIAGDTDAHEGADADEAYETLLAALAESTGGQAKTSAPYPRIHVVINPAAGKDEPIINILNKTFNTYGIDWAVSITRKYGDATEFARQAAQAGYDLVAGYGGDGTQHEIANGLMGTGVVMGILPGGTGNGFANELGTPTTLQPAVELLCTSHNRRHIDIGQLADGDYFIQRLFTGIEPDEQTSREEKDKYGTLAYLKRDVNRLSQIEDIPYRLTIDGEEIPVKGHKCYVVNSAKAGTGLSISSKFQVDDGYLDVFMLSRDSKSTNAALARFFNLDTQNAGMYYWRGQEITIDVEPDQPVWTDGEYTARTPVSLKVLPGALTVAVP
jgi:YegS/Rv2252/BmrU family lipid kinase